MTRPIIKFSIGLLLGVSFTVPAQSLSKIEISSGRLIPESKYLTWIKTSIGTKLFKGIEDSVRSRIAAGLRDEGYYNFTIGNVEILKSDSTKYRLIVGVKEGKPTLIEKVLFDKTPADSSLISGFLSQVESLPLTPLALEPVFSQILDYYENRGYPFISVKVESVQFIEDTTGGNHLAIVYIKIDKGTKSKINKIEISGNTRTRDFVILRALQMLPDEDYSQKEIDEVPEKLNRLRFFEPVETPSYFIDSKQEGVLKITVREKETNSFDGIAGYVPAANNNQSGYLTGFININLRNLFGTGRTALFRWQQENQFSQELEIRYLEPWILGYPFNIEAGLFQRKQDSTYVQRNIDAKLEFIVSPEISASLLISSQSTIPTILTSNLFTVYNSSSFTSGLNLKIDTRDDYYAPTEGIFFVNSYKLSSKKINGPAEYITSDTKTNITFQKLELDLSLFRKIFDKQIVALGIHGRELRGSDFEVSDLYFLGGTNSLRGYLEKQFLGNRIFWSNLEYRYLLSRRSYTFVFFDTGYYLRNAEPLKNISEISSFKTGYGFGLNIETGLGVLSVSFALGQGDSFSEGKIHFGIVNEF
jgi:outer membrane protein insertion porin family